MKTLHGSGHDGIANFYLKIALPVVSESLCDLFNKSLFAGKFPKDWKVARIAPIFKNGAKDDRSNYRSISIFPFVDGLYSISFICIWGLINYYLNISLVFEFYTRLLQLFGEHH